MIIHKTHTKKDIVNLFETHGIKINKTLSKNEITSELEKYLDKFIYDDKIKNLTELKKYLKTKTTKQRPTSEQKKEIMFKAKKIIKWGKNDYIFDGSTYNNFDDPFSDIMNIYMWGDLSSVRKACRYYNLCNKCSNHINPIISDEIKNDLNKNKIIKQQYINNLVVRKSTPENPVIVYFD